MRNAFKTLDRHNKVCERNAERICNGYRTDYILYVVAADELCRKLLFFITVVNRELCAVFADGNIVRIIIRAAAERIGNLVLIALVLCYIFVIVIEEYNAVIIGKAVGKLKFCLYYIVD